MAVNTVPPLNLVLYWHMHQPDYRDHLRNEFRLPWAYLHGIKDYADMAWYLENIPGARAVINFTPILLEQLEQYEQEINHSLQTHIPPRDSLLAALVTPAFTSDTEGRVALIKCCLRLNRQRMVDRYPACRRLMRLADLVIDDPASSLFLDNQYLADLVTWYHLLWIGETVRRHHAGVQQLLEQQHGYTLSQRRQLLGIIGTLLADLKVRYRKLAEAGTVELTLSPYAHPMLPLLQEFASAREAMPDVHLPAAEHYPGGIERVEWHLRQGIEVFERYFGLRPEGVWPSEGGISRATLESLDHAGFRWTATGENVIRNSRSARASSDDRDSIACWFRLGDNNPGLIARNDTLSDLIGFTYSDWHADDAVADLLRRLEAIAEASDRRPGDVVSIIMDGENAWEYYPENGWYFLSTLYKRLAEHPGIKLCTGRELLDTSPAVQLETIVAGSWVYGTFFTWVGDPDKNLGWDLLCDAKRACDEIINRGHLDPDQILRINRQLAACEGSDWFWWFGDYNPAQTVSDFEQLFRMHLSNLYQLLGVEPPQYLSRVMAQGSGAPMHGGVIRHGVRTTENA